MTSIKNHEQILIVDDDPLSRKILVRALLQTGYVCRESSDGMDALRLVRADPPSLLLLDFDMPGLNGAEVLKQLRADQDPEIAQLPAIMLTGHGGEDSEVLCLEAGADDFVTKPINPAVLRARIGTQLRLCSMRRQLQEQNDVLEAWRFDLEQDLAAARLTNSRSSRKNRLRFPGGKSRRVIVRLFRSAAISTDGCEWQIGERFFGSPMPPATVLLQRSSPLWPNFFSSRKR